MAEEAVALADECDRAGTYPSLAAPGASTQCFCGDL